VSDVSSGGDFPSFIIPLAILFVTAIACRTLAWRLGRDSIRRSTVAKGGVFAILALHAHLDRVTQRVERLLNQLVEAGVGALFAMGVLLFIATLVFMFCTRTALCLSCCKRS
jgi:uncharacterized BrkB/YihY/UPF0761 family membrane protein